jgi:hypothetical protein
MHAQRGRVIPITELAVPYLARPSGRFGSGSPDLGFEFSLIEASGSNSSSIRPGSPIAARFQ